MAIAKILHGSSACATFPPFFCLPDVFRFFACAKKGTKKAQPISMRIYLWLEYFSAEIGDRKLSSLEHFQ